VLSRREAVDEEEDEEKSVFGTKQILPTFVNIVFII